MRDAPGQSQPTSSWDPVRIRNHFPGLSSDWIFFDNAGGSQPLGAAIERVSEYMRESAVQLGASYAASALASRRVQEGVAGMARHLNAAIEEIVLASSTTVNLRQLAEALRPTLKAGDEVVVTDTDHESNITPWRRLAAHGVILREWRLNRDSLRLEIEELEPLLNPRTRLVCFTQVSNILGGIQPVAKITALAHRCGAHVCVDGVACAPHRPLDVRAWDVDYYVFSAYKLYGPHAGVLYGKHARLLELANINHEFFGPNDLPAKLQPGGAPYEQAWGLSAIPEYFQSMGGRSFWDAIADHESRLAGRLLDFLNARHNIRILGEHSADRAQRVPTISFVVQNRDSAEIVAAVDRHHIGIRFGHFYAKRLIDGLGLAAQNGVVRVSMVHYNTEEEVDRLIRALELII